MTLSYLLTLESVDFIIFKSLYEVGTLAVLHIEIICNKNYLSAICTNGLHYLSIYFFDRLMIDSSLTAQLNLTIPEVHSQLSQISKMEIFLKIVND